MLQVPGDPVVPELPRSCWCTGAARREGLGTRLMQAIESAALAAGYRLLTLDTKRGDAAERLYRRLGWTAVGTIPRYALDPDGVTPHDTMVFYKEIRETR